jgi:replicative DNA helicase
MERSHLPSLSRLRDSGQIEEAADVIMLIYRPESYKDVTAYPKPFDDKSIKGTAMVDVAKGRNIGTFSFLCGFNSTYTQFYDMPFETINSNSNDYDRY